MIAHPIRKTTYVGTHVVIVRWMRHGRTHHPTEPARYVYEHGTLKEVKYCQYGYAHRHPSKGPAGIFWETDRIHLHYIKWNISSKTRTILRKTR